jgi:hypothetical protein
MGLPQQLPGETYPGQRVEVSGELRVARNGCVYLVADEAERLVIWPAGSALADPVRLPDGAELADGDTLRGLGTVIETTALPGGPDGYWAQVTGFCSGDVPEAVVFDEVAADR